MKVLLDTCTFLWVITDSEDLSPKARRLFADPGNEVFVSSVSTWEIVVKHALGKLPLPVAPHTFIPLQRDRHAIESLPLREEATLHLARLPELHRDPFDRMLICQAIVHGLVILTPDDLILQYPVPAIW